MQPSFVFITKRNPLNDTYIRETHQLVSCCFIKQQWISKQPQQWLPFSLVNALCEAVAVCAYCFVSKQINSIISQVKSRSQYAQFVRDSVLPCFNYTLCGFTVFECGLLFFFFFLHRWLNDLPELHRGFLLKNKHKKIRVSQCRRCSQAPYSEWWSVYRFRTIQAM